VARESNPLRLEDLPDLITIPEFAVLARMSVSTAYEYASRNALPVPVIRCGRRKLLSKAALLRVLEAPGLAS
jgi:hypothetical protein